MKRNTKKLDLPTLTDYLLGDAWFGTKATIKASLDNSLTAVLRMKRNKKKYRYTAMRWGIEVCFKFATQHLGFLKEQTETFASHIASIYMAKIRYLMLVQAKLEHAKSRVCDGREHTRFFRSSLTT
ncbi:hypothetical protein [Candidatus Parabeggiatoa sp. HSG14]|uniref:hypothetical protein n=1 Tax=Candidatus Parabeggiatoa sp. HSG14 TaxID=3055593 RepID=UPI0025A91B08|nr:hypothetical protein [Thiotrichales bacterium HSG14]